MLKNIPKKYPPPIIEVIKPIALIPSSALNESSSIDRLKKSIVLSTFYCYLFKTY